MKRFLISSLVSVMGFVGLANSPAPAAQLQEVPAPTASQVAMIPQYVFSYNLDGLRQAVIIAESQGFAPVGAPQFRFVPELGGPGWVQFIVPAGY